MGALGDLKGLYVNSNLRAHREIGGLFQFVLRINTRMLLDEFFLCESALPDEASIQRRFDFASVDNRRFIYDPVKRRFVIGHYMKKSRTLDGSHAEEWWDATGSNDGFDRCVRGWFGTGGNYRNGIIHFAPHADPVTNKAAYDCLKAFVACGATAKTKLRGAPGMTETFLGKEYPDLFKTVADRQADRQSTPSALEPSMASS